jgi:hypothetical protein
MQTISVFISYPTYTTTVFGIAGLGSMKQRVLLTHQCCPSLQVQEYFLAYINSVPRALGQGPHMNFVDLCSIFATLCLFFSSSPRFKSGRIPETISAMRRKVANARRRGHSP